MAPPESLGTVLRPRYELRLRYEEGEGDKVYLPGSKRKKRGPLCGRGRKVTLDAELLDQDARVWHGRYRSKGAAPRLAPDTPLEGCEALLVEAALRDAMSWLGEQRGALPPGPAAWPEAGELSSDPEPAEAAPPAPPAPSEASAPAPAQP